MISVPIILSTTENINEIPESIWMEKELKSDPYVSDGNERYGFQDNS